MKSRRRRAVWAILTPFFLLTLFSNGVMPLRTAEGLVLVICTGEGPLEMVIDPATGDPIDQAPNDRQGHCDWASAKPPVGLAPSLGLLYTQTAFVPADLPVLPTVLCAGRTTGLPPSTGPPFRV